ncbi:MAG: BlaI/MecI/CopY family transcriptional regulator [Nanoarchaeota archaeon]|nr:BlaI/MecI/CopY family transcriptional regulator [Nanoarchaeota archaeon]
MDISILEDIGLTNAEIKIYIALLELGSSTAGPIIKKTGLQNSVVHMTLKKLLEKGYVSYIKKGKIRHYQATDPKNIIDFIEEKRKRFEAILPQLLIKQKKKELQEAEIYEGFKGFKTMHYEFIKDAKPGEEYLYFAFGTEENPEFDYEKVFYFYREFEKERKQRGIILKGIAPMSIKEKYKGRELKNVLFVDFPTASNISIFRSSVMLTPWEEKQVCFLIHSKQVAESFRKYFYSIWNKYKKKSKLKN